MHTKATLLIIFLLCSVAVADQLAESLANFDESLNARIEVTYPPLLSTPQTIMVGISANNRQNTPMPLYVIRQTDGGWEVVKLIGALAPNATYQIDLEIEVHYDKMTSKKTRYALVGRSDDGFIYGKFFDINEDWSTYEKSIRDTLSGSIVTWAPITAALMIILILATAKLAYSSKSEEAVKGEYTIRTLLFPEISGRPL
ncbi:MAG: hypothetical protein NT051_01575, partial [Candidatus Micrarchaeota archaeon]|nr:hypothetical protein [Candidatus Micrarchaeota archaeon]